MNKLQLYITKSLRGYKSMLNLNPDEDVRHHISDVRQALSIVNYDPAEKNIFYLISYIDEGTFITILRTIPDLPLDHLAAWIYVPNGLRITAEELEKIIRLTTRKVSNPGVGNDDLAQLREAFSTEYAMDHEAPSIVASKGTGYAFRYYGGDTGYRLTDFLGEHMFQTTYLPFAGVLLLDAELNVPGIGTDLTGEALHDMVSVLPPDTTPEGFMPHIYHRTFTRGFLAPLYGDLEIVWKRSGFEDIVQIVTVDHDKFVPEGVSTDESRKAITPASFYITSRTTKEQLHGCTIRVNGVEIDKAHTFTRPELANAMVSITCDGYMGFNGKLDLASTTQALIQMQKRRKIYRFELPVKSSEWGAPIKFEILCKHPLNESPIDGYVLLDDIQEGPSRTNHLGYDPGHGRRKTLIVHGLCVLVGIVSGILCSMSVSKCSSSATEPHTEIAITSDGPRQDTHTVIQQETTPPVASAETRTALAADAQTPEPTIASQDDAIKYLDENGVWDRDEMEKFQCLQGLFDDLDDMDLEKIIDTWASRLSKSRNFTAVVKAAQNSSNKKIKVKTGKHDPRYNKPGDTRINWLGYTYWIDRKQ